MARYLLIIAVWVGAVSLYQSDPNFTVIGEYTKNEVILKSDKVEKAEFIIKNNFSEELNLVWKRR